MVVGLGRNVDLSIDVGIVGTRVRNRPCSC